MTLRQPGRRRALAVLARGAGIVLLGAAISTAQAQDPSLTEAQRVAREWLALSDAGNVQSTYTAASAKFRATLTPQQWAEASAKARVPYGAVRQRALVATQIVPQGPEASGATYLLLTFRTTFASRDAAESVTMEREADGVWRLVGYSIQ